MPFAVGDQVLHPIMGAGTIIGVNLEEQSYVIRFDALTSERNIRFGIELAKVEP